MILNLSCLSPSLQHQKWRETSRANTFVGCRGRFLRTDSTTKDLDLDLHVKIGIKYSKICIRINQRNPTCCVIGHMYPKKSLNFSWVAELTSQGYYKHFVLPCFHSPSAHTRRDSAIKTELLCQRVSRCMAVKHQTPGGVG